MGYSGISLGGTQAVSDSNIEIEYTKFGQPIDCKIRYVKDGIIIQTHYYERETDRTYREVKILHDKGKDNKDNISKAITQTVQQVL